MTDKPSRPSLTKGGDPSSKAVTPKADVPRLVLYATIALVVSGVAAILASLSLLTTTVKEWVRDTARDSLSDNLVTKLDDARKAGPDSGGRKTQIDDLREQFRALKQTASDRLDPKLQPLYDAVAQLKPGASAKGKPLFDDLRDQLDDVKNIADQIAAAQKATLISSTIVLIALVVAAGAVYRGKYWSRWAVIGLWVLATFTQTLAGLSSVLTVAGDVPLLFKAPAFVSGLGLVVAVVLVNLRPSVEFFNRGRPVKSAAARAQRRGLFSARPPAASSTPAAPPANSTPDRARTKQRATTDSAAKGAELARRRAKAAKSRKSGS